MEKAPFECWRTRPTQNGAAIARSKISGEGSTGLYVRGGNQDQNLILLDEAPIYNPSHLLGFFSVFNPDAILHTNFMKGSIPVQYGGRLSSVLDLKMKEGNREKWVLQGGIGTLASRVLLEGPLHQKASFMLAGRRTYPDLALRFVNDNGGNKLNFYDLNGKINYEHNLNNHFYLSLYSGQDIFRFFDKYENTWGNNTATLRWNHLFSPQVFANFSLIYSDYNYFINNLLEGQSTFNWQTQVRDLNAKADFSWYYKEENQFKFGFQSILHKINPGSETEGRIAAVLENKALENHLYAGQQLALSSRFSFAYGLRMVLYNNIASGSNPEQLIASGGKTGLYNTRFDLAPRLNFSFQTNEKNTLKFGYSRTIQHQQELRNSSSPFSAFYIWVASNSSIPVQKADQISGGWYKSSKDKSWDFSAEAYYRWLYNQVDFVDHAQLLQNSQLEDELRFGRGWAYGIEFLLQKNKGKLSGMLNLSYARIFKKIPEINEGKAYPAYYDMPWEIGAVLQYQLSPRWSLAGNWQFTTGKAVTLPQGSFLYNNTVVPIYTRRNDSRLPDFHRLDISATLARNPKKPYKNESYWVFSLQNIYYRKNALSIDIFPYRIKETGNVPDPTQIVAYKSYVFGILPAVSYNFKF